MEFIKDYWMLLSACAAGLFAFFRGKSDIRSIDERMRVIEGLREKEAAALALANADVLAAVRTNAADIRELQMQAVATTEHRLATSRILEKIDARQERDAAKLDEIQRAITHMDATLRIRYGDVE